MKRSKIIVRFLQKNDSESIDKLLTELFLDWRASSDSTVQVEKYTRNQLSEVSDFISELDQYLWDGHFSDLGFYVLTTLFFAEGSFVAREMFLREFLADWKRNTKAKKKGERIKKVQELMRFLYDINKG